MGAAADLNAVWFVLIGLLITGYAVLDGFDFGVGMLHLLTGRTDKERRIQLNSIGPVWDGNEVWLLTSGAALFAAFPIVYATVFSGFYAAFMLLLAALIFRAVSIEFRSKQSMRWWRQIWDVSFCLGSLIASLLFGIAIGNIARGIPLDARHEFSGTFLGLLNPYALLVGVTAAALFMMHGAVYLIMKTEGHHQKRVKQWAFRSTLAFAICYTATAITTFLYVAHIGDALRTQPALVVAAFLTVLAVVNIPLEIRLGRNLYAFLSSCLVIISLLAAFGLGVFPNMVISNPFPEHSLTIYNASSSQKALSILLVIILLGLPLVVTYTAAVHWVFRGKVKLDRESY